MLYVLSTPYLASHSQRTMCVPLEKQANGEVDEERAYCVPWMCRAQGPWHTARQQMASQTAVTLEVRWLAHMKGKHVSHIWQGYAWVSLPSAKQRNKAKEPSLCLILSYN